METLETVKAELAEVQRKWLELQQTARMLLTVSLSLGRAASLDVTHFFIAFEPLNWSNLPGIASG